MKKDSVIYICSAIAVAITAIGVWYFFSKVNHNNIDGGLFENKEMVEKIDTDNRIARKYKQATTEEIDKTIEIGRSESGEFTVSLNTVSGDISIDVFAERGENVLMLHNGMDVENEKYSIDAGQGNYMIRIYAEDFTGEFDLSWTTSSNEKIETYTSDAGYETVYNSTIFNVGKIDNGEQFTIKDDNEEQKSYVKISVIPKAKAASVMDEKLKEADQVGDCYIGQNLMQGKYTIKDMQTSPYATTRTFCVTLEDGRLLLVEEMYQQHDEAIETELNKVLDKIVIK